MSNRATTAKPGTALATTATTPAPAAATALTIETLRAILTPAGGNAVLPSLNVYLTGCNINTGGQQVIGDSNQVIGQNNGQVGHNVCGGFPGTDTGAGSEVLAATIRAQAETIAAQQRTIDRLISMLEKATAAQLATSTQPRSRKP